MTTPAQARASAEKARELQEQLGKPPVEDGANEGDEGKGTGNQPGAGGEEQPPAPTPPEIDWEHRYKTLQGMFNSTVPKLQAELKEAKAQLAELAERGKQPPVSTPKTPHITSKDVEDFGEETLDVMRRAAREESEARYGDIIARLEQQIKDLTSTVVPKVTKIEMSAQANTEATFYRDIATLVPDWETVNQDKKFLDWLDEFDPLIGRSRQAALDDAVDALDANRAAAFFKAWKSTQTPVPNPTPAPSSGTNPQLEALVTPGKGRGSNPPTEKPPITREFVKQFYLDVANGKYRNRTEEKAKIEADIFAAQQEGRIT